MMFWDLLFLYYKAMGGYMELQVSRNLEHTPPHYNCLPFRM